MSDNGLIACSACKHQFGKWRMQCPACGTRNEKRQSLSEAVDNFMAKDRPIDARILRKPPRERKPDECIFCRRPKAEAICQECHEPVHVRCLNIHTPACKQFQTERVEAEKKVAPSPAIPRASSLENVSGLADAINRSLKERK